MVLLVGFGDPILSRKADPVSVFDDALALLAEEMRALMVSLGGLGLAAPQVGVSKQIFVSRNETFVNPELLLSTGEDCVEVEGCLSLPGLSVPVMRKSVAVVQYHGCQGNITRKILVGAPSARLSA